MNRTFVRIIGILVLLFTFAGAQAQDWTLTVSGTITKNDKKLDGAVVTLYKNGSPQAPQVTGKNGKYTLVLEPNNDYIIAFGKPGHITKKIEVNTMNVPPDRGKYGFGGIKADVNLSEIPPNLTQTKVDECLGKPLAFFNYDTKKEDFTYDMSYANKMSKCLERVQKLQDSLDKVMEKRADSLKNVQNSQIVSENAYNAALQQADAYFKAEDYVHAKASYQEALKYKPEQQYPKDQIIICDQKIKEKQDRDKIELDYKNALAKADGLFKQENYADAKTAYQDALKIKPQEKYPQDQIVLCDQRMKDKLDKDKLEQQYKDALAKADGLFKQENYADAKTAYQDALKIKPTEKYPQDQINICDQKLKDKLDKDKLEADYKTAIAKADALFKLSNWADAKTAYQDALKLKPTEKYPQDQITICDQKLKDKLDKDKLEQQYKDAITKADGLFKASQWADAKTAYQDALNLKPTEKYPQNQILICDQKLKDIADKDKIEQQYKDAIVKADGLFNAGNYADAKTAYQDALKIKPLEKYPPSQILICDQKLKDLQNKEKMEQMYKDAITKADGLFNAQKYAEAKTAYQSALNIKPGEKYPQDQIVLCDKNLADKLYNDAITKADGMFKTEDYKNAKTSYQDALKYKPTEKYPQDQINICDQKMKERGDKDKIDADYKAAITKADALFKLSNWADAKTAYQDALKIKPEEKYPQDQINICDQKMKDKLDKDKLDQMYKDAITKADGLFKASNWADAKTAYQDALNLKPTEKYPQNQILICDQKMKDKQDKDKLDQQYKDAITKADGLFNAGNYADAKTAYQDALKIKPLEKYPPSQILICDQKLKDLQNKEKMEQMYKDAITKADGLFNAQKYAEAKTAYQSALNIKPGEKYPQDQIVLCDKNLGDKLYNDAITKADGMFKSNDFVNAKTAYQDALKLRPTEKYPQDQITLCDKNMADKLYNDAITKADGLFKSEDYKNAKTSYQDALKIKSTEKYPQDQINICDQKMKEKGDKDKLDADYKAAITKADGLFKLSNWADAKTAYQDALKIKPTEKYPQDQVTICDQKLKDLDTDKLYKDALLKADNLFKANNFADAKTAYQGALNIKANEKYPQDQIALCEKKLKDLETDNLYKTALGKADGLFKSNDFVNAKTAYQDALNIKPLEKYPKDQIIICDQKIKDNENLQKYSDAIKKGDDNFKSSEFNTALTYYTEALKYKPKDKYATDQAALCVKNAKTLQQYNDAIAKADALFKAGDFVNAKTAYQDALKIREDKYPHDQITECDRQLQLIADQKLKDQKYKDAIARADKQRDTAFKQIMVQPYNMAKSIYNEALSYRPNDPYALGEIKKIDDKLAQLNDPAFRDKMYVDAVNRGDQLFSKHDYYGARDAYKEAQSYFPDKPYPPMMIQKCDQEIAKIEQEKIRKRNYDDAIKNADEKFNKNNWEDAITFYQQALTFIPNDKYATDQIDACNAKIQERDLKNKSDANWAKYKEVMNNADIKFKSKDYIGAKSLYQQASGLEPNEELPKDRIKQCDELMKQKPVDNGYSVPVDLSARKKRYDKLRAQYGLGHTQLPETTEQNKKINTLINITDNPENADVYVKINWNTGLVFYYKNDVQISQSDYDNAVQQILQQ